MKNTFEIKKLKGSTGSYMDYCTECNKKLIDDGHYVEYGPKNGKKKYHLTCFKKREDRILKKTNKSIKNIKSDILVMDKFKTQISNTTYISDNKDNKIKSNVHIKINDAPRTTTARSCHGCGEPIYWGDAYILYGSAWDYNNKFHFQCFQKHANKLLIKRESYQKELLVFLKELEQYSTEMICESL